MGCSGCNGAGFGCFGWHCRVYAPCLSCLLHGSLQGCSCHTCMKKPWVKVAHQSQDANSSINEGSSLPPPLPAECLVQAAVGPAVWAVVCHQSCKQQLRHNLASYSLQPPCNTTDSEQSCCHWLHCHISHR